MGEKLTKLYNTLCQIETKGENTKLMAICLSFTQQLINEANTPVDKQEETVPAGG